MLNVILTYPRELNKSIKIIKRVDLALSIYNDAQKYIQKNNICTLSFETLVWLLCNIYENKNYYSSSFLKNNVKKIAHEMAVKIYFDITCTEPPLNCCKEKDSVLASQKYKSEGINKFNTKSYEKKYSSTKTKILSEYKSKITLETYKLRNCEKYKRYNNLLIPTLLMDTKSHSHMSDLERFIYVSQQPASFYTLNKMDTGKILANLLELLHGHQNIVSYCTDALDNERSAFLLEEMYHGTSYLKFCLSFINNNAKISEEDNESLILLLSRLYDSNYLCLSEYIEETYSFDMKNYFDLEKGDDVRFNTHEEFQMHNEIILPIIYHVATVIFNEYHKGNMSEIKKSLSKFIESNSTEAFTYRNRLNKVLTDVNDLKNSLSKFISTANKNKEILDELEKEQLDTAESKLYLFNDKVKKKTKYYRTNHSLYEAFYLTDNCNFLDSLLYYDYIVNIRETEIKSLWHFYNENSKRAKSKKVNDLIYI